jgi:hypothetical protein
VIPRIERAISTEFFGESPNVFVGRFGYPDIGIGPMLSIEDRPAADTPTSWYGRPYSEIIELRSLMMRSKQKENIFSRSRVVEGVQEIAMSSKPVDVEMHFKKKPVYRVSFSDVVQPMGPTAPLERMRITENPKIPQAVDKVVNDDIKAAEASFMLYGSGYDVHKITSIFSSGTLGIPRNRKLVPTRYSITGIDDIIAKRLMGELRDFPSINEFQVYESRYLDNHFVILLMPGSWEFENFEAWAPGSIWTKSIKDIQVIEEYEPFKGRTRYADLQGGGYYASRLSVVEALHSMRRQARVVVFREVYEGYVVPLGVWVVRSTAKEAFKNKPLKFPTQKQALDHIKTRIRVPLEDYISKSILLRQKRIWDF